MDISGLLWLAIPVLVLIIYVVLVSVRPNALKLSRKGTYAVATVVIALVIVYTIWNLYFR